jgi:1,2-diacylglycerol 3-beta-galactosyltransferase
MDEKVRILVLTADVGFGHRSAANAVAAALRDLYGEGCQVDVVNPLDDKRAPAILRDTQTDYDKMVRQMPDVYKLQYQFSDAPVPVAVLDSAFTVMLVGVIRSLIKRYDPHVVLTTHSMFMAPLNAYITLRRLNIPFLTVVTDLTQVHRLWFNEGADLVLVPTPEVFEQAIAARLPEERIRITGIPVNPEIARQARPPSEIRAELGWEPEVTTALVVGSKRVKNLTSFLHVINHSNLPLQLILVAGGDDELYAQFEATEWHLPAHCYNFVERMPAFLRASDLVISKAGGLIVTETLACGLPMLIVDVTPGQEFGNAAYVVNNGAGELVEDPVDALETLCHWLARDGELLSQRARMSASLGRPRSAYAIAELAWAAAAHGRLVPNSRLVEWIPRIRELLHTFDITISDEG